MAQETLRLNLVAQDRMSRVVKGTSSTFDHLVMKVGAAAAAYVSFRAVQRGVTVAVRETTEALKEGVRGASDYEQASIRLAQAMKSSNNYTEESYEMLLANASALQRLTNYTDNEILAAEAMLATFKLAPEKMKLATEATLDMAAATGSDLVQSAIVMGKAFVGVTGMLSRYGIIVDQADLKTRGYLAVVDEINKEFGGQAQAVVKSYGGAVGQVSKAYSDLLKQIGRFLTEAPEVRGLLRTTSDELYRLTAVISEAAGSVSILSVGMEGLIALLRKMEPLLRHGAVWWNLWQIWMFAVSFESLEAAKQFDDLWRAMKKENEQIENTISYLKTLSDQLDANTAFERRLLEVRRAGKDELVWLQEELDGATAALEAQGYATQKDAEYIAALRDRIKELTAVVQEIPDVITPGAEKEPLPFRAPEKDTWDSFDDTVRDVSRASADTFENEFTRQVEFGMLSLSDRLADAMFDTKTQFKDLWQAMAKDAMSYFFSQVGFTLLTGLLGVPIGGGGFFTSLLGSKGMVVPAAQHGYMIPGHSWEIGDTRWVRGHPGEAMIPRQTVQNHPAEIAALLGEARTGQTAQLGAPTVVHQHHYHISAWDADSVRQAFRHGKVQREAQLALQGGYIEVN